MNLNNTKKNLHPLLLNTILCFFSFHAINSEPIMSYAHYATVRHATPYIYQLRRTNQTLFYCGMPHSFDPQDEHLLTLKKNWYEFLQLTGGVNCVVLVEGNLRSKCTTETDAITFAGGEGGLITFLADQVQIPVECPEPPASYVLNELRQQFSEEEIVYKMFASAALQFSRETDKQKTSSIDAYLQGFFKNGYPTFKKPATVKTFKHLHSLLFDTTFDIHDKRFFYDITNPVKRHTVINRICSTTSIMRDNHIVEYIANLAQEGKNIFIVFGHTHAVMQEPAIRDLCTHRCK